MIPRIYGLINISNTMGIGLVAPETVGFGERYFIAATNTFAIAG
jgi:hypothetical protein